MDNSTSTKDPSPQRRSDLLWVVLGLLCGAVAWFGYHYWHAASAPEPLQLQQGTWLMPAQTIPTFALLDHERKPFTPQRLKDHWTFMFFGYTHCPDVCPTTMTVLASMVKKLEQAGVSSPQVVFVTVDPLRDTVEQLSQFIPYFNAKFIGVTGARDDINALTRNLGIVHGIVGDNHLGENYLVDHSAAILLFNPQGQYNALFSAPHTPANLAEDFTRILRYHEGSS